MTSATVIIRDTSITVSPVICFYSEYSTAHFLKYSVKLEFLHSDGKIRLKMRLILTEFGT